MKKLNLVPGEDMGNRARYWVYTLLNDSTVPYTNIDWRGVNAKTVWNFVSGGKDILVTRLAAIAATLNVDITELLQPIPRKITPNLKQEEA